MSQSSRPSGGIRSSVVRSVGGILIAAGLALTCSDPGVSPPDTTGPTGTLTIRVAGLPSTAAGGGSALVLRTDLGNQATRVFEIPPNGSLDLTLVAGTYDVRYLPPSEYSALQPNPLRGVVVPASDSAVAAFSVSLTGVLQIGVLQIVVNVVAAPYPATGGSALVVRTDIEGQTPFSVDIPNQITEGYFAAVSVLPGTYDVTYTPPNGYRLTAGSSNAQTVVVVVDNTTVATFDITP